MGKTKQLARNEFQVHQLFDVSLNIAENIVYFILYSPVVSFDF